MHKSAITYAIERKLRLGRFENGFYFLRNADLTVGAISIYPTAKSAITMMRKACR